MSLGMFPALIPVRLPQLCRVPMPSDGKRRWNLREEILFYERSRNPIENQWGLRHENGVVWMSI